MKGELMIRLEEFLVAMEYGYLQCERGNNIQQARINAKKLWNESGSLLKLVKKSDEDPITCKYCDKRIFP